MKHFFISCFLIGVEGNYDVVSGKACSGSSIEFFFKKEDCTTDGEPSHYGRNQNDLIQPLGVPDPLPLPGIANLNANIAAYKKFKEEEVARCEGICDAHPDCRGFSSLESELPAVPGFRQFMCTFWKNGDLSQGSAVNGWSCHKKKSKKTGKCNKDGTSPSDADDDDDDDETSTRGREVEIQLQIPKLCPQQIPREEVRTRTVDVLVPVPETITKDVPCPVPTPVQVPVPVTQTVHVRVPVPNVIERRIPTPVTVQVQVPVPVPTPVQNPIPCPVPQTIQQRVPVPVFVDRVVDVPVPVPVPMQMPQPTVQMLAPTPYDEPALAYGYGQPIMTGLSEFNGMGIAGPAMPSI